MPFDGSKFTDRTIEAAELGTFPGAGDADLAFRHVAAVADVAGADHAAGTPGEHQDPWGARRRVTWEAVTWPDETAAEAAGRVAPSPEAAVAADAELQVKVWLVGISPMVWRRILVPARFTLRELHGVI